MLRKLIIVKVKTNFLDRFFLLCIFLFFDFLAFCPFLFVLACLTICFILSIFLFTLGGTFLSCLFGVNPNVFWGIDTQIFQIFGYFFKWYNYLGLGMLLLFLGLWGVFFFLFSLTSFIQTLFSYIIIRYKVLFRKNL